MPGEAGYVATMAGGMRGIRRYTATAQALHWIVAALMFTVLPLAWVMVNMPRGAADRDLLYTLHKSIGLTILALAVLRTGWRIAHPPPPPTTRTGRIEHALAEAAHILLYVVILGMPISGYLLSAGGGNAVSYFGLFTVPTPPRDDTLRQIGLWVHVAFGQWLVYALLLLHLAAVALHVALRRDGTLDRMLPAQQSLDGGD